MHAIGPDQHICLDLSPIGEVRGHRLAAVFKASAAGTKVDDRRAELSSQQLLELGAVNQDEPRSPPLCHHVPRDAQQPPAIRPLMPCPASFTASCATLPASPIAASAVNAFGHRPTPAPTSSSTGACS